MRFSIVYLSFFVIYSEGDEQQAKRFKLYQTLDQEQYSESTLKAFIDSEFSRICKRRVEKHPTQDAPPTRVGRFVVEPGHGLDSNANYNLMQRLRTAADRSEFEQQAEELLRVYMETSAVRGGVFLIATAVPVELMDEPLLFLMKCDFEAKIAAITDERQLLAPVETAISARNIKSIQYPYMPEPGMLEPWEVKIHQASHARYFEDFLRYVTYEKPIKEIVNEQVLEMVHHYIEQKWAGAEDGTTGAAEAVGGAEAAEAAGAAAEEVAAAGQPLALKTAAARAQEEAALEVWAASDRRELQHKWAHASVVEAAAQLTAYQPELTCSFKLGGLQVKGLLADYGRTLHFAQHNGRFVAIIEGDAFQFERGMSPVELLAPEPLEEVLPRIGNMQEDTAPWDEED